MFVAADRLAGGPVDVPAPVQPATHERGVDGVEAGIPA